MKTIVKHIKNLINVSENCELEFKSAKGGFPESFWDCAHNKEKVSATMLTERDVIDTSIDNNRILIFRIPRSSYDIRPVFLSRNPILQKFFTQLGIGEKAGSGADFIIKGCDDNKWIHPTIEEKVQPDRVTMIFYIKETDSNQSVPSLSPVCPQSVLSLSPVCPKLNDTNENIARLVLVFLIAKELSISSLMLKIGEKNKNRFRQNILNPLIEANLIEPTIKDKPNSSKQAYRLIEKAKELITS